MEDIILVTGATGFTGKALAMELLRRGKRVRAFVRSEEKARDLSNANAEIFVGDITKTEDVLRAAKSVHTIYHIAALFRTAGHPDSYYYEVNVKGVENIVRAATKNDVARTVHCSTVGVHGNVGKRRANEESPFNPGDIYQETKLLGEQVAQNAIKNGLPLTVIRPAGIYGPGDLRFLKLFKAIKKGRFIMLGSGETLYHFTYIDDLVDGIILCGESQAALGETFILCGEETISLNDLARTLASAFGKPAPRLRLPLWPVRAAANLCEFVCVPFGINPPLHNRRVDFFVKDRAFSCDKAKSILKFSAKTSVSEGIKQTADWYFKKGLLK